MRDPAWLNSGLVRGIVGASVSADLIGILTLLFCYSRLERNSIRHLVGGDVDSFWMEWHVHGLRGGNMNRYLNCLPPILLACSLHLLAPPCAHCQRSEPVADPQEVWTSVTTGKEYKLRIDGDHVNIEGILPPALQQFVQQGAFFRCDLVRRENVWDGTCTSYMPYGSSDESQKGRIKWCRIETKERITLLSKTRIEGEYETLDLKESDTANCAIKKGQMRHFAWIPKK